MESRTAETASGQDGQRILVVTDIDITVSGIAIAKWGDVPNVADYESVILDLVSLSETVGDGGMSRYELQKPDQADVLKLLESNGRIIGIIPATPSLTLREGGPLPIFWWSPIPLQIVLEEGTTRDNVRAEYDRYFKAGVEKWRFIFRPAADTLPDSDGRVIPIDFTPLATPRYHASLAAEVSLIRPMNLPSGRMILLPGPDLIPVREAIQIVLQDVLGFSVETPPPDWVDEIDVPGERELKEEIGRLQGESQRISEDLRKADERLTSVRRPKRLLYETGSALETAVSEALGKLGAEVYLPDVPGREDRWFEVPELGKKGAVEVKGRLGSIKRADVRQTEDWVSDIFERMGERMKGILIGNPYRNHRLQDRRPPWPKDVIGFAKGKRLALVTTAQLFAVLVKAVKEESAAMAFFRLLFETDGPLVLD